MAVARLNTVQAPLLIPTRRGCIRCCEFAYSFAYPPPPAFLKGKSEFLPKLAIDRYDLNQASKQPERGSLIWFVNGSRNRS